MSIVCQTTLSRKTLSPPSWRGRDEFHAYCDEIDVEADRLGAKPPTVTPFPTGKPPAVLLVSCWDAFDDAPHTFDYCRRRAARLAERLRSSHWVEDVMIGGSATDLVVVVGKGGAA